MKKALLAAILTIAAIPSVQGQAKITLYNSDTSTAGGIYYGTNSLGIVGHSVGVASHVTVGVYYAIGDVRGAVNTAMAGDGGCGLVPLLNLGTGIGATVALGVDGAGIYNSIDSFSIPGTTSTTNVTVVLVAYDGPSYASSMVRGHSAAFVMTASAFFGDYTGYYANAFSVSGVHFAVQVQPLDTVATAGTTVVLDAIVANGFDCQWRLNGTNISGANGTNYTIPSTSLPDAGAYDVIASNISGKLTSLPAVLQVLPANAPSIAINGRPAVGTVPSAMPANVIISNRLPAGPIYYSLDGSAPTTNSSTYAGPLSVSNSAVIRAIHVNPDFSQAEAPSVNLLILPTYPLNVSTSGNGTVASLPTNTPYLTSYPTNGPYLSNTLVSLVATPGAGWWFSHWNGDISGSENPANIVMNGPKNVQAVFTQATYVVTLNVPGGRTSGGNVTVNGVDARIIDPDQETMVLHLAAGSVASFVGLPNSGWSFLSWAGDTNTASNPLNLSVNEAHSLAAIFGTVITTNIAGGAGSIVISPPNPVANGATATLTAYPAPGYYFVQWSQAVGGTNNPTTLLVRSWSPPVGPSGNPVVGALFAPLPQPPSISDPPHPQIVPAGTTANFAVTASGHPPPSYQWRAGGSQIAGATSSTLAITNASLANLALYSVVVSNAYGVVTSSTAGLYISPTVLTPYSGSVEMWGRDATLAVGAIGSGTLNYQWLFNGNTISGATSGNLALHPVQLTNQGFYSVLITSPFGAATNPPALLVVNPANISVGLYTNGQYAGVTIDGVAGYSYGIQYATNLDSANSWQTLTNLTLQQPVGLWIDTSIDARTAPSRYYRINVGP